MRPLLLVLCTSLLLSVLGERRRYDGFQIWETKPKKEQYSLLFQWENEGLIDVMGNEVLIAPEDVQHIHSLFHENNIIYTVQNMDIQVSLDETWKRIDSKRAYDPNDFNSYEDIVDEVNRLANEECPLGFDCTTYSIGESLEGRDMLVLRVSQGSGRQALWFDSLIHAREWLAGATLMRVLDQFLTGYGEDEDATFVLDNFDIYFLPVHNPDGYHFTFATDRFWRKNRRPNSGSSCFGVDLNRNYDYAWSGPGGSSNPCSETFYGTAAGSEPEVAAVQSEVAGIASTLVHYTNIHTVIPAWLIPYAAVCSDPPNIDDAMRVANAAVAAIEATHGTSWGVGTFCRELYQGSGTAQDWAYDQGIPFTATPELRGPGFNPPPSTIQPSFEEMWNGFVAMAREIDAISQVKK